MRTELARAVVFHGLAKGGGSYRQQLAYQELEWRRCRADYNYWRRHYCYLKLKSGEIIPWSTPFPIQESSAAEWQSGESTIEVKSRQLGETTNATHFALWDCMFSDAAKWNFFGAGEDESKDMMDRLRATMDRLPQWMLDRSRRTYGKAEPKRQDRKESVTTYSFGLSELRVFSGSVRKAQGLAGKSILDDFGKHEDQERKWQLLYPTIDDPDPANRGQVIIIFNGNGEDFAFHLYQKAKRGEVALTPHFYSWRDDPRRLWVTDSTGGPRCDLEDRRERYPWYENAKSQYMVDNPDADELAFKAQYPDNEEEAFYISGNSRFKLTKLQGYNGIAHKMGKPKVGYLEEREEGHHWHTHGRQGVFRLYEEPVEGAEYVIGIDPAGGHAASDYSAIQVCRLVQHDRAEIARLVERYGWNEPPTVDGLPAFEFQDTVSVLEQVLTYQARAEPTMVARQSVKLGEWYNDALLIPERNSHGVAVIDAIKPVYWNIYQEVKKEKYADDETERLGYWTGPSTKDAMIDWLAEWLDNAWVFLRDTATVRELSTFGWQTSTSGKQSLGAPKGMNDDLVDSLALCVVGARSILMERSKTPTKVYKPWEI